VAAAIALFSSSVAKFRATGTPVPARKPTTAIVRTGPYRLSRNPIYLAFSVCGKVEPDFLFEVGRARPTVEHRPVLQCSQLPPNH
jgi:hypothetical protein